MDQRRVIRILAAAFAAFVVAGPALAQQRHTYAYCDRLQAQYRSLLQRVDNPGARTPRTPQFDRLSQQLARAQRTARRYGCTGGTRSFRLRGNPQCRAILAQVAQVSRQLQLSRRRGAGAYRNPTRYDLARMRKRLAAKGCAGSALNMPAASTTTQSTYATQRRTPAAGNAKLADTPRRGGRPVSRRRFGSGRTLCVRVCDGYYFPIEFRARYHRFKTDAAACQSMYAADGQAELFVQPATREVADARSLTGERYGDQAYAFAFRDSYMPACAAQLHQGVAALAARYFSQIPQRREPKVALSRKLLPLPQLRRPRGEDPETLANAAGRFSLKVATLAMARADPRIEPVRMVGPAYYAELFDLTRPRKPHTLLRRHRGPTFSIISPAVAAERPAPTPIPN